jgi:hypothetical protein
MRGKSLLILAILVVLGGAGIFFFERHSLTTDEQKERAEKLFGDLERDKVVGLEITGSKGSFVLAKKDDAWRLSKPVDYAADDSAVSTLLGSLLGLEAERRLGAGEVDPAAYGLDKPEVEVVMIDNSGVRHTLAVGAETPLGNNRAVSLGTDEVILVSSWFARDLDKPLDEWRSHEVVDVYADQLASLEVTSREDRISAVRDGEQWKLLAPVEDLADREHLRSLVSELNALRVEEFVTPQPEAAQDLGFTQPEYRVTLVRSEGKEPITLDFGARRDKASTTQVACRRNGSDTFWVRDQVLTRLAKAPVLWRSKVLYPFDTWNVESISISAGDTSIKAARTEGLWKLDDGSDADYNAVQDRLTSLSKLEAVDFDLVPSGTATLGEVEITLKAFGEDAATTTVHFRFSAPLQAGGKVLVSVDQRPSLMSVEAASVDALLSNLDALRAPKEEESTTSDEEE